MEQAIKLRKIYGRPHVIWMRLGTVNERTAQTARQAGMNVVMDKYIMQGHKRLFAVKEN